MSRSRNKRRALARQRKFALKDEPLAEGDDWVEWGGMRMWAAGFTSGGAPYGLTVKEFRASNEQYERDAGWARAKRAIREAIAAKYAPDPKSQISLEIGWVKKVGDGLSREIFATEVDVSSDSARCSGDYVALVPRRKAAFDSHRQASNEAWFMERLANQSQFVTIPEFVGAVRSAWGVTLVRRFVRGVPLDLRAGRMPGIRPWEVVGRAAAAIHGIDVKAWRDSTRGYMTRREHAQAMLEPLWERPESAGALAWAQANLPDESPSVPIHGDLLGQNILLAPGDSTPAIIDWEYATFGDPAYDLAIVTRGVRQPFQIDDGLRRLVDAYAAQGGCTVTQKDVRFYELCLAGKWYRDALLGQGSESPDQALSRLKRILAWAQEGEMAVAG